MMSEAVTCGDPRWFLLKAVDVSAALCVLFAQCCVSQVPQLPPLDLFGRDVMSESSGRCVLQVRGQS